VLEETEVAIGFSGVGFVLALGQILDPVNDLIERFSWVVLAAGASLGAQSFFLICIFPAGESAAAFSGRQVCDLYVVFGVRQHCCAASTDQIIAVDFVLKIFGFCCGALK
jgi:hypothetical protein